jgi:hypothetical protein
MRCASVRLGEGGDDAAGQRDVRVPTADARRGGEEADDRQQRGAGQLRRFVDLGVDDVGDARYPTNVYKLHLATLQTSLKGVVQLPKYIPGVGTGFGMSGVAARWDKIRGGLFGAGVTRNIMIAYRFLAEQYEAGDEIYIFGFSRGAFTARSLAGLIRSSGLPPNHLSYRVPEALRRYRDSSASTKPGTESSHRFRLQFSPELATSETERDWRVAQGHPRPHLLNIGRGAGGARFRLGRVNALMQDEGAAHQ